MLNTVYQLVAPRQFSVVLKEVKLDGEHVIVSPTYLSICHADQRYFQGLRSEDVLKQKLPMALIHEGIGKVIYDPTKTFSVGDEVVMVPNHPKGNDEVIAENYLRTSRFRSSGIDGYLSEFVSMRPHRLVKLPKDIHHEVAAFTELVSVGYHAIARFEEIAHARKRHIGVWGDGNLGFIVSLLLSKMYPESEVYVFGVHPEKLQNFTFAKETYSVREIPHDLRIDHAFECVGGSASANAINQIIDIIEPEGTVSLLGVSEDYAPLNTRMILEKGLRLFGSSRSGTVDFQGVIDLYQKHPDVVQYLESLIGQVMNVRSIKDIVKAFEADLKNPMGKTILKIV